MTEPIIEHTLKRIVNIILGAFTKIYAKTDCIRI